MKDTATQPVNRMKVWRQTQAKSGKRRMDVFVNQKHYETLKSIRQETGESYGEIIGRLLSGQGKPGVKLLTLEIPEKDHKRLAQEYPGDDLIDHMKSIAIDKARKLFAGDEGDF